MNKLLKRAILGAFETPEKHPTASDILKKIEKDFPIKSEQLEKDLEQLVQSHLLYSLVSSDNQIHYGKAKGSHNHFICQECGCVQDFLIEEGANNMIDHYIQKRIHSFGRTKKINVSVEGICNRCNKTK